MFQRIDYPAGDEVQLALRQFIANAYAPNPEFKYPERWHWCYELRGGHSFLAWSASRIVGHVGAMPAVVWSGTQEVAALWSVDSFVLPDHRGCGIGKLLQQRASAFRPLFMSVWMSERNWNIKSALGHVPIASMVFLESRNTRRAVAPFEIGLPDAEDIAQASIAPLAGFDFFVIRSREYCQWRYLRQPFAGYFQVTTEYGLSLARKCGPRLPNTGMVSDVFCNVGSKVPLQIESTAQALVERGCDCIRFATADLGLAAALVLRGWTVRSKSDLLINADPAGGKLRRVFLSLADQDMDQYPG